MLSVRIVTADHYMSAPIPGLDVTYSDFRKEEVEQVPVIRLFGSNSQGVKTCVHVHGVFPYICVPYDSVEPHTKLSYQLAVSLDKAINISLGNSNSQTKHVHKIVLVSGIPFYGYHRKEHQFLKIYFYKPAIMKKAVSLLENGAVLNKVFQPHEAHVAFMLQFFIDFNLYGMSYVHFAKAKYRNTESAAMDSVTKELLMPDAIKPISTLHLEADVVSSDVLNPTSKQAGSGVVNPGLAAIWDDEKHRRLDDGITETPRLHSQRLPQPPTESDVYYREKLKAKLESVPELKDSLSGESLSGGRISYPSETPAGCNVLEASFVCVHSGQLDRRSNEKRRESNLDDSVVDEELVKNLNASQMSQKLKCSQLDEDDMELLMVMENLAHHTTQTVDANSALGSQPSETGEDPANVEVEADDDEGDTWLDRTLVSEEVEENRPETPVVEDNESQHSNQDADLPWEDSFWNGVNCSYFISEDKIPQLDGANEDEKFVMSEVPVRRRFGQRGRVPSGSRNRGNRGKGPPTQEVTPPAKEVAPPPREPVRNMPELSNSVGNEVQEATTASSSDTLQAGAPANVINIVDLVNPPAAGSINCPENLLFGESGCGGPLSFDNTLSLETPQSGVHLPRLSAAFNVPLAHGGLNLDDFNENPFLLNADLPNPEGGALQHYYISSDFLKFVSEAERRDEVAASLQLENAGGAVEGGNLAVEETNANQNDTADGTKDSSPGSGSSSSPYSNPMSETSYHQPLVREETGLMLLPPEGFQDDGSSVLLGDPPLYQHDSASKRNGHDDCWLNVDVDKDNSALVGIAKDCSPSKLAQGISTKPISFKRRSGRFRKSVRLFEADSSVSKKSSTGKDESLVASNTPAAASTPVLDVAAEAALPLVSPSTTTPQNQGNDELDACSNMSPCSCMENITDEDGLSRFEGWSQNLTHPRSSYSKQSEKDYERLRENRMEILAGASQEISPSRGARTQELQEAVAQQRAQQRCQGNCSRALTKKGTLPSSTVPMFLWALEDDIGDSDDSESESGNNSDSCPKQPKKSKEEAFESAIKLTHKILRLQKRLQRDIRRNKLSLSSTMSRVASVISKRAPKKAMQKWTGKPQSSNQLEKMLNCSVRLEKLSTSSLLSLSFDHNFNVDSILSRMTSEERSVLNMSSKALVAPLVAPGGASASEAPALRASSTSEASPIVKKSRRGRPVGSSKKRTASAMEAQKAASVQETHAAASSLAQAAASTLEAQTSASALGESEGTTAIKRGRGRPLGTFGRGRGRGRGRECPPNVGEKLTGEQVNPTIPDQSIDKQTSRQITAIAAQGRVLVTAEPAKESCPISPKDTVLTERAEKSITRSIFSPEVSSVLKKDVVTAETSVVLQKDVLPIESSVEKDVALTETLPIHRTEVAFVEYVGNEGQSSSTGIFATPSDASPAGSTSRKQRKRLGSRIRFNGEVSPQAGFYITSDSVVSLEILEQSSEKSATLSDVTVDDLLESSLSPSETKRQPRNLAEFRPPSRHSSRLRKGANFRTAEGLDNSQENGAETIVSSDGESSVFESKRNKKALLPEEMIAPGDQNTVSDVVDVDSIVETETNSVSETESQNQRKTVVAAEAQSLIQHEGTPIVKQESSALTRTSSNKISHRKSSKHSADKVAPTNLQPIVSLIDLETPRVLATCQEEEPRRQRKLNAEESSNEVVSKGALSKRPNTPPVQENDSETNVTAAGKTETVKADVSVLVTPKRLSKTERLNRLSLSARSAKSPKTSTLVTPDRLSSTERSNSVPLLIINKKTEVSLSISGSNSVDAQLSENPQPLEPPTAILVSAATREIDVSKKNEVGPSELNAPQVGVHRIVVDSMDGHTHPITPSKSSVSGKKSVRTSSGKRTRTPTPLPKHQVSESLRMSPAHNRVEDTDFNREWRLQKQLQNELVARIQVENWNVFQNHSAAKQNEIAGSSKSFVQTPEAGKSVVRNLKFDGVEPTGLSIRALLSPVKRKSVSQVAAVDPPASQGSDVSKKKEGSLSGMSVISNKEIERPTAPSKVANQTESLSESQLKIPNKGPSTGEKSTHQEEANVTVDSTIQSDLDASSSVREDSVRTVSHNLTKRRSVPTAKMLEALAQRNEKPKKAISKKTVKPNKENSSSSERLQFPAKEIETSSEIDGGRDRANGNSDLEMTSKVTKPEQIQSDHKDALRVMTTPSTSSSLLGSSTVTVNKLATNGSPLVNYVARKFSLKLPIGARSPAREVDGKKLKVAFKNSLKCTNSPRPNHVYSFALDDPKRMSEKKVELPREKQTKSSVTAALVQTTRRGRCRAECTKCHPKKSVPKMPSSEDSSSSSSSSDDSGSEDSTSVTSSTSEKHPPVEKPVPLDDDGKPMVAVKVRAGPASKTVKYVKAAVKPGGDKDELEAVSSTLSPQRVVESSHRSPSPQVVKLSQEVNSSVSSTTPKCPESPVLQISPRGKARAAARKRKLLSDVTTTGSSSDRNESHEEEAAPVKKKSKVSPEEKSKGRPPKKSDKISTEETFRKSSGKSSKSKASAQTVEQSSQQKKRPSSREKSPPSSQKSRKSPGSSHKSERASKKLKSQLTSTLEGTHLKISSLGVRPTPSKNEESIRAEYEEVRLKNLSQSNDHHVHKSIENSCANEDQITNYEAGNSVRAPKKLQFPLLSESSFEFEELTGIDHNDMTLALPLSQGGDEDSFTSEHSSVDMFEETVLERTLCEETVSLKPNPVKEPAYFIPVALPPSRSEVKASLASLNIPETINPTPFYSNYQDVKKKKEVGGTILHLCSRNIVDLEEFQSSVIVRGIYEQQKALFERVLDAENAKVHRGNIACSLVSDRTVYITPVKLPPSAREVVLWTKAKAILQTEKRSPVKSKKVVTKMSAPLSPGVGLSQGSADSISVSQCSSVDVSTPESGGSTQQSTPQSDSNSSSDLDLPPLKITPISRLRRSAGVPRRKSRRLSVEPSLSSIKEDSDESHAPSSDSQDSSLRRLLMSSQFKNQVSPLNTNMSDISCLQIEGLNRSKDFRVPLENLQHVRNTSEHQFTTLLILELHIGVCGELKPDPERDAIRAVFYTVVNDVPEGSSLPRQITGVIAVEAPNSSAPLLSRIGVNANVTYTADEVSLLKQIIDFVREWDPDIVAGYEIEMLSWGYLIDRANTLGVNLKSELSRVVATNENSNQKKREGIDSETDGNFFGGLSFVGRIVIDVWRLMRNEVALQSYSFENIAYHILHQRLPVHSFASLSFWWEHSSHLYRWRTVQHYLNRVTGIARILDQLDFIGRTSELARLFGIQFFEVLSRGSQFRVESMMLRLAKPLNFVPISPSVQQRARMKAPEMLPLIMEPESRFYSDPVIVLDFQSLYPSMIIAYNYCFSTCLGRVDHLGKPSHFEFGCCHLYVPPGRLKKLQTKLTVSPCGVAFVKPNVRRGILPQMLEEILEARLAVKDSMKRHRDDRTLQRVLHARQLGLKLIANVTYGYTAANFSGRMPCIEVGDSVVSKGRETLERAITTVHSNEGWRARVVYGDTDSLFVLVPGRSREEAFRIGAEIAETVTQQNPSPVKLKLEKVYQPCILQTKKRYVGYMYESPNQKEPVYDAKGIETVRRDGCPAVAKMLEKTLRILFETANVSLVKNYVCRQFTKMFKGRTNLQDFIFAKEYRGMANYRPGACVPALELTRRWLIKDRRSEPRISERVPYVIVNGPPGLPLIHLVRSPRDLLVDSGLRLNVVYYITRAIIPPLDRCISLIGADVLSWYNDLPRKKAYVYTVEGQNNPRKNTISQYFCTVECVCCGQLTNRGICVDCRKRPQIVAVQLSEKLHSWEHAFNTINKVCQSCIGSTEDVNCISLDCPILYRRLQASREYDHSSFIRRLKDECANSV